MPAHRSSSESEVQRARSSSAEARSRARRDKAITRIAHISDIHLAPLPWPRMRDVSVKRLTGFTNWHGGRKRRHRLDVLDLVLADIRRHRPDHIAVTGDLANIGLPAELKAATDWLAGLGGPELVTLVPGNHDVYVRLRRDPGIERWRAWMTGEHEPGAPPLRRTGRHSRPEQRGFPFVKRLGGIAIIGVSSAVPTPVFRASGRLGAGQLAALETQLARLGGEGLFRLLLIHHPPLPGQAKRGRGLDDAADLAAVLARTGAELVLHGHNHRQMQAFIEGPSGPIPVIGVPSASAAPPDHVPAARYNLFDIESIAEARWRIEMTGWTLDPAGAAIIEAERVVFGG
ncbi:MAG: metallophosphoesterase [Hyphomicrobiaceae bacterium]